MGSAPRPTRRQPDRQDRHHRGTQTPAPAPPTTDVGKILGAICTRRPRKDLPLDRLRDRVLFETAYVCGARASEICGLYVEDLDLRPDTNTPASTARTAPCVLSSSRARGYVALLRLYLFRTGYTAGPLFRASINGRGGPLSYDAAHHRWTRYCTAAGLDIDIH
jgi:integrase/recombinase XerD